MISRTPPARTRWAAAGVGALLAAPTLFAVADGQVEFREGKRGRTFVSVVPGAEKG